jgi:putative transposase
VRGVDVNLKNVAVTGTGRFFDGGELLWRQNHPLRVRRSLSDRGTRPARQALRRLSRREHRFVPGCLHTVSRGIVEEALRHDCAYIAVENLTDIRERTRP